MAKSTKKTTKAATKGTTKASSKPAKKSAKKKPTSRKTTAKKAQAKKATTKQPVEKEVDAVTAAAQAKPSAANVDRRDTDRRKVQRRRQIDPTTCERDYSNEEIEFMCAMDEYKRNNGRMFPTCSEILEVVRALGYVRQDPATLPATGESAIADASPFQDSPKDQANPESDANPIVPPLRNPDASFFGSTDSIGQ